MSKRYLPTRFPPHGMAALYAGLVGRGFAVRQYDRLPDSLDGDPDGLDVHGRDRDLTGRRFLEYLETGQGPPRLTAFVERHLAALPDDGRVYAFSAVSYHQVHGAVLLASELLRRKPGVRVVLGGPGVTVRPADRARGFPPEIAWIRGCGLAPLSGLLRGEPQESLPGLIRIFGSSARANKVALSPAEDEPAPDFTGLDLAACRYDHPELGPTLFLPYRLTKGCPSACAFCAGRLVDPFSHKSPAKVVAELAALTERFGSKALLFTDASINARPRLFVETCRLLARELPGLRWYAYARVKGFGPRQAEAAASAGCFALFFGAESAHAPTIARLGKGFTPPDLEAALASATGAGVKSVVHLMYNTPWEDDAEVEALLEFVTRHEGHPLVEFMAQRFLLEPDTPLFSRPGRHGLANLRPVAAGFFDRPEYAYDLVGGPDWDGLRRVHAANRERLAPALARIEARVFPRDASGARRLRELM